MGNRFKKIISDLIAFAIAFSLLAVPASADEYASQPVSWWDSYILKGISSSTNVPFLDAICVHIADHLSGAVCAGASPDNLHHADSYESCAVDKDGTPYVSCICKYCGDRFKAVASDLSAAYDAYVSDLPANSYNSDGSLLVIGPITSHYFSSHLSYVGHDCNNHTSSTLWSGSDCLVYSDCSSNFMRATLNSGKSSFRFASFLVRSADFLVPYSGYYQLTDSLGVSGVETFPSGDIFRTSENWQADASPIYYEVGSTMSERSVFIRCRDTYYDSVFSVEAQFYPPVYKFVPASSADVNFDATYNINTRPTSITGGNYGIVGDNGQIVKVEDNSTIVNETNNTYYNPATGTTSPIILANFCVTQSRIPSLGYV